MRNKPTISITLDPFVLKVLDGVAKELGITRSAVIGLLVRKYINKEED